MFILNGIFFRNSSVVLLINDGAGDSTRCSVCWATDNRDEDRFPSTIVSLISLVLVLNSVIDDVGIGSILV